MGKKTFENAGWGKRERGFGFGRAASGTKRMRRVDPNVGGFTRLRDDIKERRAREEEPKAEVKAEPNWTPPATNLVRRLQHIRERLRTESMPTREREQLQAIEQALAAKLK